MDADNLVRMANRIGDFFESMPDREEALLGIATHIRKYWAPSMRQALVGQDMNALPLTDIVRTALTQHRDTLLPR